MNTSSKKRSNEKGLIFIVSLLYPFYTLPFAVSSMLRNQRFGYLLFSLFLSYLAYLMIPYDTMDMTRHYEAFGELSTYQFSQITSLGRIFDYTFHLYCWTISHLGLPKEFVPFSIVFITYSLYFSTLKKILDNTPIRDNKNKMLSFKVLTLLGVFLVFNEIRFVDAASGMRSSLAFSIFIYAMFDLLYKKSHFKFCYLSILASCIHIAVLPPLLILLVSRVVKTLELNKYLLMLAYALLITGTASVLFSFLINALEPLLHHFGLYFRAYMSVDGAWGMAYYDDKNIKTIILEKILKPLPLYLAGSYFLLVKNYIRKDLVRYLSLLFIFIVIISISRTMFDRYNVLFVTIFVFFLIIELQYKPLTLFKKIFILVFIGSLVLVDIGGLYKYRDIYWRSWGQILYTPVPIALLESTEIDEYIIRHSGK